MISSIELTGFTSFIDNSFSFVNGVNVLIGKSGTGKTHVLKCLASALQARHEFLAKKTTSKEHFEYTLAENVTHYFKPDFIGNLVNKSMVASKAFIKVTVDDKNLVFSFFATSKTTVKIERDDKWDECQFVYIPSCEMFSLFEGFIGLSSKRELSFEQTYINLAHSLALPVLRDIEGNPLKPAIGLLERELSFKVLQMNGRFYIQTDGQAFLYIAQGGYFLQILVHLLIRRDGQARRVRILFVPSLVFLQNGNGRWQQRHVARAGFLVRRDFHPRLVYPQLPVVVPVQVYGPQCAHVYVQEPGITAEQEEILHMVQAFR